MPLALLLSPDDQAVSAITAVLEEMSVACERPLDGVSAAKQLSSQNFDLVIVDCENLPAAKLIFDVCRRGKNGKNPVPIAIVDGRAGLPTAFRLGAELILTKPVAKDQARTTIRTAVNRVKKEQPTGVLQTTSSAGETMQPALEHPSATAEKPTDSGELKAPVTDQLPEETPALAPAASSQMSPAGESAPAEVSLAVTMTAAAAKLAPEPGYDAKAESFLDDPMRAPARPPSDDPVLAELERTESQPETAAESPESSPSPLLAGTSVLGLLGQPEKQSEPGKRRAPLVALVAVALVCAGLYAAWMTQPGFRSLVQPQVERVLGLVGIAGPAKNRAPAPVQVKPAAAPAPVAAPAQTTPSESTQSPQSSAGDGTGALPAAATTVTAQSGVPNATNQVKSTGTPGTNASTTGAATAGPGKTASDKAGAGSNAGNQNDADITIALPGGSSKAGATEDSAAVVLSSKGAESRLIHSVPPSYKAAAGSNGAEVTVVLKAVVDENGKVTDAQVVEGNAALRESAVTAVKQWRYRPYLRDGKAVPFQTIVLVDFSRH